MDNNNCFIVAPSLTTIFSSFGKYQHFQPWKLQLVHCGTKPDCNIPKLGKYQHISAWAITLFHCGTKLEYNIHELGKYQHFAPWAIRLFHCGIKPDYNIPELGNNDIMIITIIINKIFL